MMISWKSNNDERSSLWGATIGRGPPLCQEITCRKVIQMFKNISQRSFGRGLLISSPIDHDIIKWSQCMRGESTSLIHDLWSLRQHCIKPYLTLVQRQYWCLLTLRCLDGPYYSEMCIGVRQIRVFRLWDKTKDQYIRSHSELMTQGLNAGPDQFNSPKAELIYNSRIFWKENAFW